MWRLTIFASLMTGISLIFAVGGIGGIENYISIGAEYAEPSPNIQERNDDLERNSLR
jgi:hypothetical protein